MTQDNYEEILDPDNNYFDLVINPSPDELDKEFHWIQDQPGSLRMYTSRNLIITAFQQDFMFRVERELWKDPDIRRRLIANRKKYLGENVVLTPTKIINGFKISGIHRGYSGFNPTIVRWFIEHYNLQNKTCYDPCGGFGQRILGGGKFGKQIYNDKSAEIATGVKNIVDYFELPDIEIHNHDCREWEPDTDFDAILTCPPYYNIEDYGHERFNSKREFNRFIDSILSLYEKRDSCRICGLIIKDDLMHRTDYSDKFDMIKHQCHFNKKASKESLFVWRKDEV